MVAARTASRDELNRGSTERTSVAYNTIVGCPVYDGMSKTSVLLAQPTTGNEVQVINAINACFARVRLDKGGQVRVGYPDRRCFGEHGNKRGNRK